VIRIENSLLERRLLDKLQSCNKRQLPKETCREWSFGRTYLAFILYHTSKDTDNNYRGAGIGLITDIPHAADVVERSRAEAIDVLKSLSRF
jgi:hypothetical protein